MRRRSFMQSALLGAMTLPSVNLFANATNNAKQLASTQQDRSYFFDLLRKIAEPVLLPMSSGRLQQTFQPELSPTWDGRNPKVAYMECFGRLMSGIAPWLALPDDNTAETPVRKKLVDAALASYAHSVNPKSPDYLHWEDRGQALVDSAYFTQALMRAPQTLWEPLPRTTKNAIISRLKALRAVNPPYTNWLLFAAINEAFLLSIGEAYDPLRLSTAVRKMNEWYAGDGWIKDGEIFHFDYYNSYVIHPMLTQVLDVMVKYKAPFWHDDLSRLQASAVKHMQRYAEHMERFISPEGCYPPIGRSLTYRTAAFQPLALLAWKKQLPQTLPEGQIRAALTAVHKAIFTNPSNFTEKGFLTIGFAGHQPELGDWYSNSGSMYITTEGLLALGLAPSDSFWTLPAQDWTQKKAFQNIKFPKDYHLEE